MENIRDRLRYMSILNSTISFSLRNDTNSTNLLQTQKTTSIETAFTRLYFPNSTSFTQNLKSFNFEEDKFTINGFISLEGYHNKNLQLIYVNKRKVNCS